MFIPKIVKAQALDNYRVRLEFADGVEGIADLSHLAGKGVFALWNAPEKFKAISIEDGRRLSWGDEIELDADSLYLKVTGKSVTSLFPALKEDAVYA